MKLTDFAMGATVRVRDGLYFPGYTGQLIGWYKNGVLLVCTEDGKNFNPLASLCDVIDYSTAHFEPPLLDFAKRGGARWTPGLG